ncbi:AraC family transcriptional regulator [Paenibacillus sp. JDR-2]|uniref:AraC family transcriptional regulator n=1 Tax=Paenibacillus sp. (strain JDR-2) TaxID=324057 RepID=UPI0001665919|nr:AraC family transcriptional regulator [Paenibacillus sp. JDR-2]ACT01662.1 transcriptional regulator, AraC family [Paenibacillus sp. JDR-2]
MDLSDIAYPKQRTADYSELTPSVHWAQLHQTIRNHEYPLRRIYDFELLYVLDGRITAHLGGTDYSLSTGEMLFISAGVPHNLNIDSGQALFLGIHFDFFDEFDIVIDQDIIVKDDTVVVEDFCSEALLSGCRPFSDNPVWTPSAELVKEMETVIKEFTLTKPGFEAVCKGLMISILINLQRSRTEAGPHLTTRRERMTPVVEWIEQHYMEDCSNETLAKLLNIHEDYLGKQFKSVYGMSLNKYVQSIRHREAKRLLRESDATVEQVSREVGYEDMHYFSRIFNKWEGLSPREYRKTVQFY